jgi:hypothetical protein
MRGRALGSGLIDGRGMRLLHGNQPRTKPDSFVILASWNAAILSESKIKVSLNPVSVIALFVAFLTLSNVSQSRVFYKASQPIGFQ